MTFGKKESGDESVWRVGLVAKKLSASALALTTALAATSPAWATIDNTVTATGSSPGNTDDVTATATENVDVEDSAPAFTFVKSPALADTNTSGTSGVGDATEVVTYTYTYTNTGNVTINDISITDSHEGTGTALTISAPSLTTGSVSTNPNTGDGDWDILVPGETITWTSTYTIVTNDIVTQTDNDLDNTATVVSTPAVGAYDPGQATTATATVPLAAPSATMTVAKLATAVDGVALTDPDAANVEAGDVVTYTYTVVNTGNVPISGVSLSDSVTAGTGAAPTPANETLLTDAGPATSDSTDGTANDGSWDVLGPGDTVTFTGTYTVTQADVDTLQ